jgi:FRG domain
MDLTKLPLQGPPRQLKELLALANEVGAGALSSSERWAFRGQSEDYGNLSTSLSRAVPTRDNYATILHIEKYLLKEFRRLYLEKFSAQLKLPEPKKIGVGFDMRCLSVMQHYEIPTRLLDWTANYWIALFFACSGGPEKCGELWAYQRGLFSKQPTSDLSVASLTDKGDDPRAEPQLLNRFPKSELYEVDLALTPRMQRQEAHHTFCTHPWVDHADALCERAAELSSSFGLLRVRIEPSAKPRILGYLAEHHGITEAWVYPDLAGLSKYLCERVRYWNDELS